MIFSKNVLTFIVNYTAADQYTMKAIISGFFTADDNFVRLDEDSKASCEGLLNVNECLNALKTMEANKSPGSDGFPAEFYKVLWSDLAPFLVNAINRSFQKGLLSVTQRQGIISLLLSFTKEGQKPSFSKKLEANFSSKLRL